MLRKISHAHIGLKTAPKCDFVYKINETYVFFQLIRINIHIFVVNDWKWFILT